MYRVEILWDGVWHPLAVGYRTLDEAEWAIAVWRSEHGSNGNDTGLRAVPVEE